MIFYYSGLIHIKIRVYLIRLNFDVDGTPLIPYFLLKQACCDAISSNIAFVTI